MKSSVNSAGKQFVSACGCARSGTSVTTDLIRQHNKIVIGRARYNNLFKANKYHFVKSLFNQHRFCKSLRMEDTHNSTLDSYYHIPYEMLFSKDKLLPEIFKFLNLGITPRVKDF